MTNPLPGTKDIEVASAHRLQAIECREHAQVLLADDLLQRIRRKRPLGHLLVLRQCRRISVGRRRTGEHDAANAGVPRSDQDVQRRIHVRPVGRNRILDRTRHRWNGGLMENIVRSLGRADGELGSARSPCRNSTPSTCARLDRFPVMSESATRTWWPRRTSSSAR